jgi:4-hydroxybenzoate polyprenyltransferase
VIAKRSLRGALWEARLRGYADRIARTHQSEQFRFQAALDSVTVCAMMGSIIARRDYVLLALLKTMRPKQWAKNVFVFVGIFFDGAVMNTDKLLKSSLAFVIFCLVSSAIYLINDLVDFEKDRLHPVKRNRPLASGALKPIVAQVAAVLLLAIMLPSAFYLQRTFGILVALYAALTILYSFVLKNIVILDVMTIAAGFVLRVAAGTAVIVVTRFSPWLYVCTTLGALFIGINKRRNELLLLAENANGHRASLQDYNKALLDDMTTLVTSCALAAYSFYTFSAPNLPSNHAMMLTIPIVIYGIFRYQYLVRVRNLGGAPEDLVLGDRPLLLSLLLFAVVAGAVIYLPF